MIRKLNMALLALSLAFSVGFLFSRQPAYAAAKGPCKQFLGPSSLPCSGKLVAVVYGTRCATAQYTKKMNTFGCCKYDALNLYCKRKNGIKDMKKPIGQIFSLTGAIPRSICGGETCKKTKPPILA